MSRVLNTQPLKARLAVGTAMASLVLLGYGGRIAYAACPGAGGTYVCSGFTNATQDLDSSPLPLSVTTASDFDILTATGNALNLTGVGGVNFTDEYASTITGYNSGLVARNSGSGDIEITTTGAVLGQNETGMYVQNGAFASNLTIHSAQVTGLLDGVVALNEGDGAVSITTTGHVSGATQFGIVASNQASGTDVMIETTSVHGDYVGIITTNYGSGLLSITSTGTVSSNQFEGIYARNVIGTHLTIETAAVAGGYDGVTAINEGSGRLSITTSDPVIGNGGTGVFAVNHGNGALAIATQSDVNGYLGDGIFAQNYNGNGLTIDAVDVYGNYAGIMALHEGSGALSITTTGDVIGQTFDGIYAKNNNGTDLTIMTGLITGTEDGLQVKNYGTGAVSITATGKITGKGEDGIEARNYNGTDLTIQAEDIYGEFAGVNASNRGTGAVLVNITGHVEGNTSSGIRAENDGTDITINAASVEAFSYGIRAVSDGTGAISITATGKVVSTGNDGILARLNSGTDIIINAGSVIGGSDALEIRNDGTGSTNITLDGIVTGGTSAAIDTYSNLGIMTNINLNKGAVVSAASGVAIKNREGNSNIQIMTGASVTGDFDLRDGSDDVTFDGGTFGGTPELDGGDDYSSADGFVDRLTITGNSGTVRAINWEEIFLSKSVFTFTGDLTAPEILSLTNSSDLTVSGNFTGTDGQLFMDVDLASDDADSLSIGGTSSGTTTLFVDAGKSGPATGNDITLVSVAGGAGANDFMLADNLIGAYLFDLDTNGNDFFLTNPTLSPETPVFEAYPKILAGLNSLSSFSERFGERLYAAQDNAALGYALMGYAAGGELEAASMHREKLVWSRIEGTHSHLDSVQSSTGADYDINQGKLRLGMDAQIAQADRGLLIGGLNASYGEADADIASVSGAGRVDATGISVGASLSWLGSSGLYADAQAQYSWFSSDLESDALGVLERGNDGTGQALSLEIGQRFENSTGLAVTPQAQLVYSAIDFEDFTSAYGTFVTGDDTDSLQLRAGLVVENGYSRLDDAGHGGRGTLQAIANVYHEFRDGTSVAVAGTPLNSEADAWTGELGFGAGFASADGIYAIRGNALVSTGLEDFAESYAVKGTTAVTVSF